MSDLLNVQQPVENAQFNAIMEKTTSIQAKADSLLIKTHDDTILAVSIRKEAKELEKDIEDKRVTMVKPMNDMVTAINQKAKEIKEPILTIVQTIDSKVREREDEQRKIREEEQRKEREKLEAERKAREEEERKIREEEDRKRKEEQERIAEQQRIADEKMKEAQKVTDEAEKSKLEAEAKIAEERKKLEQERMAWEEQKRKEDEDRRKQEEEDRRNAETLELAKVGTADKVKGTKMRWKRELLDETKVPSAYKTTDSKKVNEAVKNGIRDIDGIRIYQESGF